MKIYHYTVERQEIICRLPEMYGFRLTWRPDIKDFVSTCFKRIRKKKQNKSDKQFF